MNQSCFPDLLCPASSSQTQGAFRKVKEGGELPSQSPEHPVRRPRRPGHGLIPPVTICLLSWSWDPFQQPAKSKRSEETRPSFRSHGLTTHLGHFPHTLFFFVSGLLSLGLSLSPSQGPSPFLWAPVLSARFCPPPLPPALLPVSAPPSHPPTSFFPLSFSTFLLCPLWCWLWPREHLSLPGTHTGLLCALLLWCMGGGALRQQGPRCGVAWWPAGPPDV